MVCHTCHSPHETAQMCRTFVRAGTNTLPMGRHPEPQPVVDADALIGMQLGSFRIIRRIGGGGMGSVYLAEHAGIGSRVAVKILHPHLAQNPSLVNRFRAEALAVNVIGHENIVSIFDLAVAPSGEHYLVMEHLEGRPLAELADGQPLDQRVAIPILAQVCDALAAAHGRGVVHRDLKPDNIFLTRRGGVDHFVKLLDFGIAKLADMHISPQTSQGVIVGTPEYMAPEQYTGGAIDGRADIYALGTIAYLLATGTLPFRSANLAAMMLAHRDLVPQAPHELNPKITRRYSDVILRALAKKPENRFHDAAEFRMALLATLEPTQPNAPLQVQASTPPPKPHLTFDAVVLSTTGQELRRVKAQDLSKGGVFLSADCFTPALLSRMIVQLTVPGGTLELPGEVVRHVSAVQSAAWGMPTGVGLQFVDLSPETRRKLERVLGGQPLEAPAPAKPDVVAEAMVVEWKRRSSRDLYTMLASPLDADFDTLRTRGREAKVELEALKKKVLPAEHAKQIDRALEKLTDAVHTLTSVQRRAEYDATRGNYRGVARCIAAGLTVTDLERARNRFLPDHPGSESRARIHATTAEAYLSAGNIEAALHAYEQALTEDPLTLRYHQRYWSLRRQPPTGANDHR